MLFCIIRELILICSFNLIKTILLSKVERLNKWCWTLTNNSNWDVHFSIFNPARIIYTAQRQRTRQCCRYSDCCVSSLCRALETRQLRNFWQTTRRHTVHPVRVTGVGTDMGNKRKVQWGSIRSLLPLPRWWQIGGECTFHFAPGYVKLGIFSTIKYYGLLSFTVHWRLKWFPNRSRPWGLLYSICQTLSDNKRHTLISYGRQIIIMKLSQPTWWTSTSADWWV